MIAKVGQLAVGIVIHDNNRSITALEERKSTGQIPDVLIPTKGFCHLGCSSTGSGSLAVVREVVVGTTGTLSHLFQRGFRSRILLIEEYIEGVTRAVGKVQVGSAIAV